MTEKGPKGPFTIMSRMRPSNAHRWTQCTASIEWEKYHGVVEPPGVYAEIGTALHRVAERCGREAYDALSFAGTTVNDVEITHNMAEAVENALLYMEELTASWGDVHTFYEARVDCRDYASGYGYVDVLAIGMLEGEYQILILDYKFGHGIKVDVIDNYQLVIYAMAFLNRTTIRSDAHDIVLNFKSIKQGNIHIAIAQPFLNNYESCTYTYKQLSKVYYEQIAPAREKVLNGDTEFVPGIEQCNWCTGKVTCDALAKFNYSLIAGEFERDKLSFTPQEVGLLTPDDIGHILQYAKLIRLWLSSLEQHAKQLLDIGQHIEGLKLVNGKRRRYWTDEKALKEFLSHKEISVKKYTTPTLISPAQLEKTLGKKLYKDIEKAGLVDYSPASHVLATIDDKRSEVTTQHFEDLENAD